MRCWLLRSWVREGYIEVEQIADGEGSVEYGDGLGKGRKELALNLIESLVLHADDINKPL